MKKLFQRSLSLVLALLTVITLLPVVDLPTEAQAVANEDKKPGYMGYAETEAQVYAIVDDYYKTVTKNESVNAFWNANIRNDSASASALKQVSKDTGLTAPSGVNKATWYLKRIPYLSAVTNDSCTYNSNGKHGYNKANTSIGCTSNGFKGVGTEDPVNNKGQSTNWQCQGFAAYMAWVVFGSRTSEYSAPIYGAAAESVEIKAGDVLRINGNPGHSIFVYEVNGDRVKTIECNMSKAGSNCKIYTRDNRKITDLKKVITESKNGKRFICSSPLKKNSWSTNVEFTLTDNCNLYAEPYSTSDIVTATPIAKGSVGVATEIQKNSQGNYWYRVSIGNENGWIYGSYCEPLRPAADAVTVTARTNLHQHMKSETAGISIKDKLQTKNCTITAVTGAIRNANNVAVKNTDGDLQEATVTGSYTTFTANVDGNKAIDKTLKPRKLATGLYQYTLDVAIQMNTTDGKTLTKTTFKDIRVLADWFECHGGTPSSLQIKFNANGGTCAQLEKLVYKDKAIGELPIPSKLGSFFQGWYTAKTGGTKVTENSTFTQNTTLYAQWKTVGSVQSTNKTYTIQYNGNGGVGTMPITNLTVGVAGKLSRNAYRKTACVFTGWNTAADGSGTAYTDQQEVLDVTTKDKAVVTLYAQWRELTEAEYLKDCTKYASYMKLTATTASGSIMARPVGAGLIARNLTSGETLVSTALYKNPNGEYWYKVRADRDGMTGYVYGGNVRNGGIADKTVNYNVTLAKTNIPLGKTCNISGSVSAKNGILYEVTGKLNDADPHTAEQTATTKTGFSYIAGTAVNQNLAFGKLSRGNGTLVLIAKLRSAYSTGKDLLWEEYTAPKYTLNFTIIGTSAVTYAKNTTDEVENMPAQQTKTDKTDLTLAKEIPERAGYTFLGWATSADALEAEYQPGETYRTDAPLALYAVWQKNDGETVTYTIRYSTDKSAYGLPDSQTKTQGVTLTLSNTVPSSQYYTFKGWEAVVDGETLIFQPGDAFAYDRNVTLTAIWEVTSYLYDAVGNTYWELGETFSQVDAFDTSAMCHVTVGFNLSSQVIEHFSSADAWFDTHTPDELGSWDFVPMQLQNRKLDFYVTPGTWITLIGDINCAYTFQKSEDVVFDVQILTMYGNGGLLDENDPLTDSAYSLYAVGHPQDGEVFADFTRTGYTLLGWTDDPNSTQVIYSPDATWSQISSSHTKLYAVWQENAAPQEISVEVPLEEPQEITQEEPQEEPQEITQEEPQEDPQEITQ